MKFATRAIHEGSQPDSTTGAVIPPIYMTSTFKQHSPGNHQGYDYTRAGNPNFSMAEKQLASLENSRFATVFSSGLGALTAYLTTLQKGDHVIALNGLYGGTFRLLKRVFQKFGIELTFVSTDELDRLEEYFQKNTKLLLFETPTNPLLDIFDIAKLASQAKKHGVITLVDNTFATPFFQNPLDLGADVVWHSCTKYLGGHSDIIGGALMTNDEAMHQDLQFARMAIGVNPSPFDVWLLMRSIKTLSLRMLKHAQNAQIIAELLHSHPLVKQVYYPGLPDHPNHAIARRQMSGFGGIVSVEFNIPMEQIQKILASLKLFTLAESLGGVESLVNHPASMTHASIPREKRLSMGLRDEHVRFSIGIEDTQDLIEDLLSSMQ